MKLSYLNKIVNLKIPKTTIRLKQKIIDELYEKFEPEPIPIYENERFVQQVFELETEENLEEVPVSFKYTRNKRCHGLMRLFKGENEEI